MSLEGNAGNRNRNELNALRRKSRKQFFHLRNHGGAHTQNSIQQMQILPGTMENRIRRTMDKPDAARGPIKIAQDGDTPKVMVNHHFAVARRESFAEASPDVVDRS